MSNTTYFSSFMLIGGVQTAVRQVGYAVRKPTHNNACVPFEGGREGERKRERESWTLLIWTHDVMLKRWDYISFFFFFSSFSS